MHYVAFLMNHGRTPYRTIIDMNMPGAFLVDDAVIHTLGGGSVAWRIFDLLLIVSGTFAMVAIAEPVDWFAGLFGGVLFGLIHGRDGIFDMGQRDFVIAVLLLLSFAALFRATRRESAPWMFAFGVGCGLAAAIKPTFLLLAPVLLVELLAFRRREEKRREEKRRGWSIALAAYGVSGFLLPLLGILVWLWRAGALRGFVAVARGPMLYHASLAHRSTLYLLSHSISPVLPLFVLWVLILPGRRKYWANYEGVAILTGVAFGLLSYLLQGKGYPYQRYPLLAFLLLAMALDFTALIRQRGLRSVLSWIGIAVGALFLAPAAVSAASRYDWRNTEFLDLLETDLNRLGGPSLSGEIQCIDTIGGCYNALYRMKLVQSANFTYDEFLFGEERNGVIAASRQAFWTSLQAHPPQVIVVVDGLFPSGPPGFAKLARWPQMSDYLRNRYRLYDEVTPPDSQYWWSRRDAPRTYRIYLRRPEGIS